MMRRWQIVNRRSGQVVVRGPVTVLRRQLPLWRAWYARLGLDAELVLAIESTVETARRAGAV